MPKVSIVMPCYNDGKYIKESILSVKKQSYTDWELIIVNDGSDDIHTISVLNDIKTESNIRVVDSDNRGPAAARNLGIKEAAGVYILPLDADDIIYPTYIEKAVSIIETNDNIGIVYCEAEFFGKKSGKWDLPEFSLGKMLHDNIIFVTALFRKCDWVTVGGFNENLRYGVEDYDFWLSILELGRKVYRIPQVLFKYRIKKTSRSIVFQTNKEKYIKTYEYIVNNHIELYKNNIQAILKENRVFEFECNRKIDILKRLIPGLRLLDGNTQLKKIIKFLIRFKY